MSTIGNDVQPGSNDSSLDGAAAAFLKRWEDGEKSPSKDEEDAQTDTSDETDEETADTESDDTESDDEGSDEDLGADAEDSDEQDADEDEKSAKSASDDMKVIITVDGEEHQVSVKELKRLYGQESSLTRKSQAVAAKQREYEESTTRAVTALQTLSQKAMERWKPYAEIDWAVAQTNLSPADFTSLRQQAKSAYDEAKFLTEELDTTMKGAQEKYMSSLRERADDTLKLLQDSSSQYHIPNWSNTVYDDIRTFATSMGMAQSVVDTLVDPAAIKIIHLAMLQSKAKDVVTKKVAKAAPKKVLTSKKAPDAGQGTTKSKASAALNKAKKSGKVDDAAAAFMARWS